MASLTPDFDSFSPLANPPDYRLAAQDLWQADFDSLENKCLGETGAINQCISNEGSVCDLKGAGCLPHDWLYSCVDRGEPGNGGSRTLVFNVDNYDVGGVFSSNSM